MNRTTLIALAGFVVLLGAVLVLQYAPPRDVEEGLRIDGWGADEGPMISERPAAPALALEGTERREAPFDRMELRRAGETILIERHGPEERDWKVTSPIEARAEYFRLRQIFELFKDPLHSSVTQRVRDADLPLFRLDERRAIGLKLSADGETKVDLLIGGVERLEPPAGAPVGFDPGRAADTWVMRAGEPTRAYRIAGVDLRTPVDHDLATLRSKQLTSERKEDISRIVLENPDDHRYPRIVIARELSESPDRAVAPDTPEEALPPRGEWRFETPRGVRPGDVDSFAAALLRVRATDFLDSGDVEATARLAEDSARITLETAERSIVMHLSPPGERHAYLRIEGRDELYQVSAITARELRKTLADLRSKEVFPLDAGEVQTARLVRGRTDFTLARDDDGYHAPGEGLALDTAVVDSFLRDVAALTISEFMGDLPPTETGLDRPTHKLTLESVDGVHTLLLGRERDEAVFGTLEGSGEVFLLPAGKLRPLAKSLEDFL